MEERFEDVRREDGEDVKGIRCNRAHKEHQPRCPRVLP